MDKRARRQSTTDVQRHELYELYLRRHDRIDSWDLVDLAAPWVVGRYLADRPRDVIVAPVVAATSMAPVTALGAHRPADLPQMDRAVVAEPTWIRVGRQR